MAYETSSLSYLCILENRYHKQLGETLPLFHNIDGNVFARVANPWQNKDLMEYAKSESDMFHSNQWQEGFSPKRQILKTASP